MQQQIDSSAHEQYQQQYQYLVDESTDMTAPLVVQLQKSSCNSGTNAQSPKEQWYSLRRRLSKLVMRSSPPATPPASGHSTAAGCPLHAPSSDSSVAMAFPTTPNGSSVVSSPHGSGLPSAAPSTNSSQNMSMDQRLYSKPPLHYIGTPAGSNTHSVHPHNHKCHPDLQHSKQSSPTTFTTHPALLARMRSEGSVLHACYERISPPAAAACASNHIDCINKDVTDSTQTLASTALDHCSIAPTSPIVQSNSQNFTASETLVDMKAFSQTELAWNHYNDHHQGVDYQDMDHGSLYQDIDQHVVYKPSLQHIPQEQQTKQYEQQKPYLYKQYEYPVTAHVPSQSDLQPSSSMSFPTAVQHAPVSVDSLSMNKTLGSKSSIVSSSASAFTYSTTSNTASTNGQIHDQQALMPARIKSTASDLYAMLKPQPDVKSIHTALDSHSTVTTQYMQYQQQRQLPPRSSVLQPQNNQQHEQYLPQHYPVQSHIDAYTFQQQPQMLSKNTDHNYYAVSNPPAVNTIPSKTDADSSCTTNRTPKSNSVRLPLTPEVTVKQFKSLLTAHELVEIHDFPEIYFAGAQKIEKVGGSKRRTGADLAETWNIEGTAKDRDGSVCNSGFDDTHGDLYLTRHDHICYRYEILSLLGKGSFGQVIKCYDHKTKTNVALKIIRNKKRFEKQGAIEVKVLERIRQEDPENNLSLIHIFEHFYFRGHLCLTFELLGTNLYEWLKAGSFKGVHLGVIHGFAKQILNCLNALVNVKIVHCDLKPENILLRDVTYLQPSRFDSNSTSSSSASSRSVMSSRIPQGFDSLHPKYNIKVIDFGSSCFENERLYTYVQSRFYRSPEVILGIPYHMSIDMWSMGCILAELYTGYPLFPGENEQEQLACIMEIKGVPPLSVLSQGTRTKVFFDSRNQPILVPNSKGKKRKPSTKTLSSVLKCTDMAFLDFLDQCLSWDASTRIKPHEAINHPFITGVRFIPVIPEIPVSSTYSRATPKTASAAPKHTTSVISTSSAIETGSTYVSRMTGKVSDNHLSTGRIKYSSLSTLPSTAATATRSARIMTAPAAEKTSEQQHMTTHKHIQQQSREHNNESHTLRTRASFDYTQISRSMLPSVASAYQRKNDGLKSMNQAQPYQNGDLPVHTFGTAGLSTHGYSATTQTTYPGSHCSNIDTMNLNYTKDTAHTTHSANGSGNMTYSQQQADASMCSTDSLPPIMYTVSTDSTARAAVPSDQRRHTLQSSLAARKPRLHLSKMDHGGQAAGGLAASGTVYMNTSGIKVSGNDTQKMATARKSSTRLIREGAAALASSSRTWK
ncbi:hypothetical protein BDV3_002084 [Batrachochytrium dendrobatidis]